MSIVKIQINHIKNLSKEVLASHLYDLIGEEYNLNEDDVEDYFEIENVYKLPNNSFISIFIIDFPALEYNRDFKPKDIVKSYLDTINGLEEVIGLVKLQDDFLQAIAKQYFNKLFAIEMELRNVLTYILTYDEKAIEKGVFKEFGVQLSLDFIFRPYKRIAGKFGKKDGALYTEIIKYSTILERAKLRNRIFINKLENTK